jgi:5'-nucleotidase
MLTDQCWKIIQLKRKYYAIQVHTVFTIEKYICVVDWYTKPLKLLVEQVLPKTKLKDIMGESNMMFNEGHENLFDNSKTQYSYVHICGFYCCYTIGGYLSN